MRPLRLAIRFQRFQSRQQFLEKDAHFHLSQMLADAKMSPKAEGQMLVGLAVGAVGATGSQGVPRST